jgi:hypothetical protein
MRPLAVALSSLVLLSPALAQAPRSESAPSAAQAERRAVDLRPGMTLPEVQKLLGKPKRTALKSDNFSSEPGHGVLQWTYAWSSSQTLQIVFAAKAPEQWYVTSWDWSGY